MAGASSYRVLITDISTRKAFDLANIFMYKNIPLILADMPHGLDASLLAKAYGKPIERLRKDTHFFEDLCAILEQYAGEKIVYIPIEEDTTDLVYNFLQKFDYPNFFHNLPPRKSFDTVRDKGKFSAFCQAEGVPVPKEYSYEALLKMEKLPCALIAKPKSGSGSVGIVFIDTKKDLLACQNLDMTQYIIQQRLENPAAVEGGFFLFDRGEPAGYYGHKRIRTYPVKGGVTIYSRCDMNLQLQTLGNELLHKLQWSGVAMVEFLYDSVSGEYKIIEVNPRLWGSLMLAEFCGSEMFENYCRSALGMPLKKARPEKERYIRWIFPWELLVYLQQKGKIKNFWRRNRKNTCYINFTYSSYGRSMLFTLYNMVSPQKLKRLFQKVTTG